MTPFVGELKNQVLEASTIRRPILTIRRADLRQIGSPAKNTLGATPTKPLGIEHASTQFGGSKGPKRTGNSR